nr:zinc finger C2H2-type/integrase DNA-binding domain-containing protein [Tanacetum cinerariifolium]
NVVGHYGGGHVVDLTKYLKGWLVTERRGQRSLKMDNSDVDLLEAAEALMSFANGHRSSVIEGSNSNANSSPSIDKGKEVVMQNWVRTESGRIVIDFDLNEVPAIMMEDEGGDANANVNGN